MYLIRILSAFKKIIVDKLLKFTSYYFLNFLSINFYIPKGKEAESIRVFKEFKRLIFSKVK